MIACGRSQGGSASAFGETSPFVQELLAPLFGGTDVELITGTETISHVPSRRRTPWPTRITPTRSSSPTTIPEPPAPATLADHSPPTAARPSRASRPTHSAVATGRTLATRLLSTTSLPAVSLEFFSLRAAADRASAPGSPLTAAPPGRLALAFTTARVTTESLAGRIITQPLPSLGGCTFPVTTSLMEGASESATPPTTARLGPTRKQLAPRPSSATPRSPVTRYGTLYIAGMDEEAGGFPATTCQSHLQVHRWRQHLDQHLHRPQLHPARPRNCTAYSYLCA